MASLICEDVIELDQESFKEQLAAILSNEVSMLEIVGQEIGDDGVAEIADALVRNTKLTRLVLTENGITDTGGRRLAEALRINRTLEFLGLQDNELTDASAEAFAECLLRKKSAGAVGGDHGGLRTLKLGYNDISSKGCAALLDTCRHDPASAAAGSSSSTQTPKVAQSSSLTSLDLQFNELGPEAAAVVAAALARPPPPPLSPAAASPSSPDLPLLDPRRKRHGLETLGLLQTGLGSSGVATIAASLAVHGGNRKLRSLDLSNNEAGDQGCEALAAALGGRSVENTGNTPCAFPILEHLFLFDSDIGLPGCAALAKCLETNPHLTNVDLEENDQLELDDDDDSADGGGGGSGGDDAKTLLKALTGRLERNRESKIVSALSRLKTTVTEQRTGTSADTGDGETTAAMTTVEVKLDFEGDCVGDQGAVAIATALKELASESSPLAPAAACVGGGKSEALGGIVIRVTLNLNDCGISEKGAAALAEACAVAALVAETAASLVGDGDADAGTLSRRVVVAVTALSLKFNPIFKEKSGWLSGADPKGGGSDGDNDDSGDDDGDKGHAVNGISGGGGSVSMEKIRVALDRSNSLVFI